MRDRYPHPPPLCHPVSTFPVVQSSFTPERGWGGGGKHSFIWPRQVCASEQGMVFRFLSLKQSFPFFFFEGLKWANYRRISGRRFSPSGNTAAVRRLGGTPLPELTSSAPRGFHLRSTGRLNKTCNSNRRRVSSFDQGLAWRAKDTSSIPGTASIFTFGIDITKENVLSLPCKQLTLYFEHIEEVIPSPQVNAKSVYVRDNLKTYFSISRWRLFFHRLFIFNFSGGRRGGRGLKKGNKIKITQKLIDKNVSLKIVRIVFLLGVSAS